jgi:RNA polymerase subunit RPABC4/transcription elongation factor Spt4
MKARGEERMNKPFDSVSAIKLEEAHFCLSCEAVTNCSDTCPACGQTYMWSLQSWLGRIYGPDFHKNKKLNLNEVSQTKTFEIG